MKTEGKRCSEKRTEAVNIRYFFIADQVEKKQAAIEHCLTNNMHEDYFFKPIQGTPFQIHRHRTMRMAAKFRRLRKHAPMLSKLKFNAMDPSRSPIPVQGVRKRTDPSIRSIEVHSAKEQGV